MVQRVLHATTDVALCAAAGWRGFAFFMAPTSCFADVDARVGFCHGSAQCRVLLCVSRRMLRLSLQGTEAESQSVCAERSRVLQAARAHA